jgi:hypothetical protein
MAYELFIEAFDINGKPLGATPTDPTRSSLKKNATKWTRSITGATNFEVRRTQDYYLILSGEV